MPGKDASVNISDAVHDFTHFELDLQTTRGAVSLCRVCSEVGTGVWEGALGAWPNDQELGVGPQIVNISDKGLGRGRRSNSFRITEDERKEQQHRDISQSGQETICQ